MARHKKDMSKRIRENGLIIKHKYSSFKMAYHKHMLAMPPGTKDIKAYVELFFDKLHEYTAMLPEAYNKDYLRTLRNRIEHSKYYINDPLRTKNN